MKSDEKYFEDGGLSVLMKAAHEQPVVPERLEHKIMLAVARRAIVRSRRRAKLGLIASLSGLGMLLAGCIAVLWHWFPSQLPFLKPLDLSSAHPFFSGLADAFPFLEEWGGWIVLTLLVASTAGFIYYLNNLFSNASPNWDK